MEIREKGYKFRGWKLGEKVMYNGEEVQIIAFDESDCDDFFIGIGIGYSYAEKSYITSALDGAQINDNIYWVSKNVIKKIKPKTPKYVRVVKEPKEEYYSDKIGNVYKVKEDLDDNKLFIEITGHGLALINKQDCEPVTKEELIQVGSYVKVKKYKEGKYDDLADDEIELWKENQGKVFKVQRIGEGWVEVWGSCWVWNIKLLKPMLNKEVD